MSVGDHVTITDKYPDPHWHGKQGVVRCVQSHLNIYPIDVELPTEGDWESANSFWVNENEIAVGGPW